MALITTKERYIEAVKELYPEGSFWDEQFAENVTKPRGLRT